MLQLLKGRYRARVAADASDLARAQTLRGLCFGIASGRDADAFDPVCTHMLIEDQASGMLVCCFRLLPVHDAPTLKHCYSAQHYDLSALAGYPGPMLELGRFCLHPDWHDPDILRIAWGALTRQVDAMGIGLLFGCTSFAGVDAVRHLDAFSLLYQAHRAPEPWRPLRKAAQVFEFADGLRDHSIDRSRAKATMPPLLRTYLLMGGWVSDHAVIDREMQTMHVFTAVEIALIPATRVRLLRAVAS
ncbi:GNAT family N-acetyltransferase [Pseudorhodobacter sp.]|uniref:GNAT family N-acetyltransferase n=1 Tax=Pseudorhodobacter sp. TaxID=1934400 RepID=UPI002647A9FD|nr:GNAT family N-acetyltransferase [Pseudorhodobacter sp.]MDN5789054.1 GNAT family N-acetyltransferase [Pseudorhodobacter sp.]